MTNLELHRGFRADHNQLTEIPYDFSNMLQRFADNQITLGDNPWQCSCNAEITHEVGGLPFYINFSLAQPTDQAGKCECMMVQSLLEKLQDRRAVVCGPHSLPESIAGKQVRPGSSPALNELFS